MTAAITYGAQLALYVLESARDHAFDLRVGRDAEQSRADMLGWARKLLSEGGDPGDVRKLLLIGMGEQHASEVLGELAPASDAAGGGV